MTKNKRYYWLKLPKDFFQSETIRWLEEQPNGIYYSNFYLKLCLMSINDEGILIRRIGQMYIPYDVKRLSELTNINTDTIVIALELLKKLGLLEILEDGSFYLNQVKNMIGSESVQAEKMREIRAKNKEKNQEKQQKLLTNDTNNTNNNNNVITMLPSCDNNKSENVTIESRDKILENRDKRKDIKEAAEKNKNTSVSISSTTTNEKNSFENIYKLYSREISRSRLCCSPKEVEKLNELIHKYGSEKVENAINIAVIRNKHSLGYIEGILQKEAVNTTLSKSASASTNNLAKEYDIDF